MKYEKSAREQYEPKTVGPKTNRRQVLTKQVSCEKNIFLCTVKNFPQIIENTRHIIQNMSEIIQNISDIFFATYTPTDFQALAS